MSGRGKGRGGGGSARGSRQPPAKQRRVGNTALTSTRVPATGPSTSSAPGLTHAQQRKDKRIRHDVFEEVEDDSKEGRRLNKRGGTGVDWQDEENYEYQSDAINEEDNEEITSSEDEGGPAVRTGRYKMGTLVSMAESDDGEGGDATEGSDVEDEDNPEAFMDLADMLDDDSDEEDEKPQTRKDKPERSEAFNGLLSRQARDDEFVDNLDEQLESDDQEETGSDMEGVEQNDEQLAEKLTSYVFALDRKGLKKRKRAVDKTEVYDESEYNVSARAQASDKDEVPLARQRIGLDDLMGSLGDRTGFGSVKKQLAGLTRAKGKTATVDAPLPKRAQDRIDRQVAYDESKKEVSKWQPLVKKNRETSHLKFPMNEPSALNQSSGALVEKFVATNDMESEIEKILEDAALLEKSQQEAEELELNKISKEEMLERRAELSKMRSLLFFKEQKQKKVAKIKSKAYRKLHKVDKTDLSIEELRKLDPNMARDEIEKKETARVQERMSLKHKNTGKWAKKMLGRHDENPETHKAVMDQLNRHDELKRRIKGIDSDDSEEDSEDNEFDDVDGAADPAAIRQAALDGFSAIEKEMDDEEGEADSANGVFAMKFMKRGLERQKKEAREILKDARKGMRDDYDQSGSDGENGETPADAQGTAVDGNQGRRTFGVPTTSRGNADDDESEVEDGDGYSIQVARPTQIAVATPALQPMFAVEAFEVEEVKDTAFVGSANQTHVTREREAPKPIAPRTVAQAIIPKPAAALASKRTSKSRYHVDDEPTTVDEPTANPWMAAAEDTKAIKKRVNDSTASYIGKADKAIEKLAQSKTASRRAEHDAAVANVTLNLDGVRALETLGNQAVEGEEIALASNPTPAEGQEGKKGKMTAEAVSSILTPAPTYESSDQDSDFEGDRTVHSSTLKTPAQHLSQRTLMQMAFANDDVAADFEDEKREAEERDAPKDVDLTLPGWGAWGGIGLAKKQNVIVKKAKHGEGVSAEKRADYKLRHVIINEKRLKKVCAGVAPGLDLWHVRRCSRIPY
ncbi:hypothetical protein HKX48_001843 [Thoreauomyces humboldtii]|nr:hypothetical protein HKX48_001843 [Thoreauomyces humboldtii]